MDWKNYSWPLPAKITGTRMYKLGATILKDMRILMRDKIGLVLMFGMPVLLVIVIAKIQDSTFELVNKNKITLLLSNRDTGKLSKEMIGAIDKIGMFTITEVEKGQSDRQLTDRMHSKDALLALVIPQGFSAVVTGKAKKVTAKALISFGLEAGDTLNKKSRSEDPITLYYHPILQEAFRRSVDGALRSALQMVESKQVLKQLYFSLNEKELPVSMENEILNNSSVINTVPVSRDGSRAVPNTSQHNVPAWTIFAMFFVVLSLGSGIVREKLSGSFTRLKTLPTNYLVAIWSKQITYLGVTLIQAAIIFSIGAWLFPYLNLPALNLPVDKTGLFIVTLLCGWCAVSYAICVGVFAQTQEQANGFGAVSIVILAALGGLMVPAFAMPDSFGTVIKLSPLHWCLEAYYGLFLEGGNLNDLWTNIIPLLIIAVTLQLITLWALKKKNLI
jgi:ABC-2 type transport system permease protein